MCLFEILDINYTLVSMEAINTSLVSETVTHYGGGNLTFTITSGLRMNTNYSLLILVTSETGYSQLSSSVVFGKSNTPFLDFLEIQCSTQSGNGEKII